METETTRMIEIGGVAGRPGQLSFIPAHGWTGLPRRLGRKAFECRENHIFL
jgi:hypothetical protein